MSDEDNEYQCMLLSKECPFTWNIPDTENTKDDYMKSQIEKLENLDEESDFKWTTFNLNLLLAYELCENNNFIEARKHIQNCVKQLESLAKANCREALFCSINAALWHVALATKAYILLKAGQTDFLDQIIAQIKPFSLLSLRAKAGIHGIKAAVLIQYGTKGHRIALECARTARDLDPDQAEWHFIFGNAMGRLRRREYSNITEEEVAAIEKAFVLHKDATYTVHLAQIYYDFSNHLYYNSKGPNQRDSIEKSKEYARKAVSRFKEAIELRPNCATLKARVAHGLIRIKNKEVQDIPYIKRLLEELVETVPNNTMVHHDLGYYYLVFESNIQKSVYHLKKADEVGNIKALTFLIRVKWQNGLRSEIIDDIKSGLTRYNGVENQAELLVHLGACYLLIDNDWPTAVHYLTKCLEIDPSAKYFELYLDFTNRKMNFLNLITYELRLKTANEKKKDPVFQKFLDLSKSIRPQTFNRERKRGSFEKWKEEIVKEQNNRR